MMSDDMTLVREFAANQSEPAFAALVERHIALVHSSALRQAGDAYLAEEITQAVFIVLVRKAASLGPKTILSAWLYRTTRFASADALRARRRRQARQQEAYVQSTLNEPAADAWAQLAPRLDDALAELGEIDRTALVLRFFENKTAREIAGALRMEEAAAQKRVVRALEKLRAIFVKRGVTLATAVIAGAVTANSVQAAPAGLALTVTVAAAKGTVVAASVTTLVKGTLEMMTWLKVKLVGGCISSVIIIISGALILNLSGAGTSLPNDSSVVAFKNYLSRPPRISRIVYSELETGRRVIAAVDGENLYYREIKPGENPDLPIGANNLMRGTPFVGRFGDLRWQIAGFNITKAFHADTNNQDPYTGFADAARVVLNGILNLGSQHVEPGSFIWKGNEFEVQSSVAFNYQFRAVETNRAGQQIFKQPLPDKLQGTVTVKNGVITEMIINLSGKFTYEYDAKMKLPFGIPSQIKSGQGTYLIEKLVLAGNEGVNPEIFQPERYVAPELTILKIVSNNIVIVEPKPNKLADQIELKTLKQSR